MNLFIATQPLQVINMRELIHEKGMKSNCLFILSSNPSMIGQIKKLILEGEFIQVYHLNPNITSLTHSFRLLYPLNQLYRYLFIHLKLKKIKTETVIVGNLLDRVQRHIMKTIKVTDHYYAVDDGFSTIHLEKCFSSGNYNVTNKKTLKKSFDSCLFGNPNVDYALTFFTSYPVKTENTLIKIEQNSYEKFKIESGKKEVDNLSIFVGSTLVERKYFKQERLVKILTLLKKQYPNLVYIPHGKESKSNLKVYKTILPIKQLGQPFEVYIQENEKLPAHIISFFSTVLVSMDRFGNPKTKLYSVQMDFPMFNKHKISDAKKKYNYLDKHTSNVRFIKLHDFENDKIGNR